MSLLSGIIKGDSPDTAKRLGHLVCLIKELGWESFRDPNIIKPNMRRAQLYIRRNSKELDRLFGISKETITKNNVVDIINPFLVQFWHIEIIGYIEAASLQLLCKRSTS